MELDRRMTTSSTMEVMWGWDGMGSEATLAGEQGRGEQMHRYRIDTREQMRYRLSWPVTRTRRSHQIRSGLDSTPVRIPV